MCHGCVYTGSFELDYPRTQLAAALHVHRIEIPYRAFPEQAGPRILSLSVDYFEQLITSVVEKKKNLNEENFKVYWKIGSRIEDRGSRNQGLRIG